MKGSVKVIVIAGNYTKLINTVNVRFVVHWGIPASVTQYYRNAGLAGLAGQPARSRIYAFKNSISHFNQAKEERMRVMINSVESDDNLNNSLTSNLIYVQSRLMNDYCFSDK